MNKPIRVLLVEDNPGDAELTREILSESNLLVQLATVADGEEAMHFLLGAGEHAGAELPNLILLDLNLPRMEGREVLEQIRRQEALRAIPVIILTSSDAEKDVLKSYQLGANCYVTKPVDLASFQRVVRAVEAFWLSIAKLP